MNFFLIYKFADLKQEADPNAKIAIINYLILNSFVILLQIGYTFLSVNKSFSN